METFWQDLKYAVRGFRGSPGFTVAAVFALALGIGANTAIFSVIDAVLLNPLAFRNLKDPGRLVMIWEKNPSLSLFFANHMPVRLRNYQEWKRDSHSFTDLALWGDSNLTLTDEGNAGSAKPEQVEAGAATWNLFPLLGIRPRLGRNFSMAEMQPGKDQVAILSDQLYKSRFNSDPQILGKNLVANGKEYRIIGVLPSRFELPAIWGGFDRKHPQIWTPVNLHPPGDQEEAFNYYVFGRLKPSLTVTQARAEMNVLAQRLAKAVPDKNAGFGINVSTLIEENTGPELRQAVIVLQVAVGFVLLIACANVGNLLLTRAVARDKEIAVRSALGASSFRIARQMISESLLLSLAAAAVGLLLAFWAVRILSALAPEDMFGLHELHIDGTVLLFTVVVAVLAGLLFGLAPASHALKKNINGILNRSSRSLAGSSNRLRSTLAVVEVALALMLLIGAGLMIRSLQSLMNTNLGFQRDRLLIMRITLPDARYKAPEQVAAFDQRLLEGVRQVPGVQSAAITNSLPMKSVNQSSFEIPGRTFKLGAMPVADWARSSDGYFETLRMPVLKGRPFNRQEALSDEPNVVVVNQAFARTFFPREGPLGKVISFADEKGTNTHYRVIGVVPNEHQLGPDNEQHSEIYLPGKHLNNMLLVARTTGDPLALAPAVKKQVWDIDKEQAVTEVGTEEAALREWTAPRRFNMTVLVNFAGLALLLAAVGLYSVLAYSVTLRTREIGIRMALGAQTRDVTRFIVRQGIRMTLVGIAIGLSGALALTRFMQSLLFGVSTMDTMTFLAVPSLLVLIAFAASYLPALRATHIDPVEALRLE